MEINSHINSMLSSQMQINQSASNLAQVADAIGDPEFSEATQDIVDAMLEQVPEVIAYEANAKGIEMQGAALDTLLNLYA